MRHFLTIMAIFFVTISAYPQAAPADSIVYREMEFPMTERDTETPFVYFNDEWIAGADMSSLSPDSISEIKIKDDIYGNRAIFIYVSPSTLAELKAKVRENYGKIFVDHDPRCEFPGGNGLFMEWLKENLRLPEGFKGSERVVVKVLVQPDGTVTGPELLKPSKNPDVNAEALRLVASLPKFRVKYYTPRRVPLGLIIPITFRDPSTIYIRG